MMTRLIYLNKRLFQKLEVAEKLLVAHHGLAALQASKLSGATLSDARSFEY